MPGLGFVKPLMLFCFLVMAWPLLEFQQLGTERIMRAFRSAFIVIGLTLMTWQSASAAAVNRDLWAITGPNVLSRIAVGPSFSGASSIEAAATELEPSGVSPVPEPSSLVLLGGTLIGVAVIASIVSLRRRFTSRRGR